MHNKKQREDSVWQCTIRNSTKKLQGYNQNNMMMMILGLVSSESGLDIRDKNSVNTYHGYNSQSETA